MAGLYIHIPFCIKRCGYCDFFSTTQMEYKEAYIAALLQEMEIRKDAWHDALFETVYFGGGTPSVLPPQALYSIFEAIYRNFSVSAYPEITLEGNPDDLSCNYVSFLKDLPVNRLSMGIQSFDDRELCLLNRRHTAQEAIDAVTRCKEAAFSNINIDLMYGLPGQTTATWSCTLDKAIALGIPHISAYHLTYEEGTALYQMMKDKIINPVDEDESEAFFQLLKKKLSQAGFVHYEISNFALRSPRYPSGRISLHNTSYWKGVHYLGLGASAHSYNGVSRSWNVSSLTEYVAAIHDNPASIVETEWLDERTRYNEYIMTRLRTMWGVSLNDLRRDFGSDLNHYFFEKIRPLIYRKMLKMQGGNVKVSNKGMFISDAIIRELLV